MKRTALVTAASIAAVVITGTAAVGANIGILSSADDSPVGELSATTEVAAPPVEVVVEIPTAEPPATPEPTSQPTPDSEPSTSGDAAAGSGVRTETFQVDRAGTVVVAVDGGVVQVASADPAAGWSWTPDDDVADDTLEVRFSSGSEVLVLHVELRSDGTLEARIGRPQPPAALSPSHVTPGPGDNRHDDDDDRYEDDDDDDRYEDDDDDRYEDDDDDRYEDDDDDRYEDDEHEGRDDDD